MPLLRRRPRPPAAVTNALGDVAVLAWAPVRTGGWLVLTPSQWCRVPEPGEGETLPESSAAERREWQDVDNAQWVADSRTVVVRWIDGAVVEVPLAGDDDRVPQVIRERVEASLVHRLTRDLPGGIQVRAAIRRDGAGELSSQVSVVGAVVVTAEVAALAQRLEAEARAAVGLPQ